MTAQLCRDLIRLVRSWWLSDRIRASPREGDLLRIEPGDVLLIGETQVEVIGRSSIEKMSGITLCLTCRTQSGSAELQVAIADDGNSSTIFWKQADDCQPLLRQDIEVWPRRHRDQAVAPDLGEL